MFKVEFSPAPPKFLRALPGSGAIFNVFGNVAFKLGKTRSKPSSSLVLLVFLVSWTLGFDWLFCQVKLSKNVKIEDHLCDPRFDEQLAVDITVLIYTRIEMDGSKSVKIWMAQTL